MPDAVLNLIVLRSADLDLAAKFYGQLGIKFIRERHGTGTEHLSCRLGPLVLEIYPRTATTMTAGVRLGFLVPDLDAAVAALEQFGAELLAAPGESPWGRRAIVADLDGHRIELFNTQYQCIDIEDEPLRWDASFAGQRRWQLPARAQWFGEASRFAGVEPREPAQKGNPMTLERDVGAAR